ncbi:ABC transporter ATP-binding protein [Saccharomonospora piscinae]|uniref:ABC transporter n=1 Tax=Saccharomonospora piscinae TaxID=687388 RepID=A0A1V8ZYG7_SACPI|nr:ABC transporter ATP-binding protein [Saccharomonospora piscinae]OQO89826.1 ABC transporter [Saccharomonospora piscinae]TLW90597.1 ABC transporter ATP-binding protein [Saccharomonospora piscinae]
MADPVLRVVSLSHAYGRRSNVVHALTDVSFDLRRGAFVSVMGPSGSGKSTLLRCASGIDRPASGAVLLDGTDLTTVSEVELTELRRTRIGFVFQEYNLIPALTTEQNIALPRYLAGDRPSKDEVTTVLSWVSLGDLRARRPSELSGGQRQRAAIARALISEPDVVFADEPTGSLDSRSSDEVLRLLRWMADERGRSVVMVTHDPVAAAFSDRVLFLADGRLVDVLDRPTAGLAAERMARLELQGA